MMSVLSCAFLCFTALYSGVHTRELSTCRRASTADGLSLKRRVSPLTLVARDVCRSRTCRWHAVISCQRPPV